MSKRSREDRDSIATPVKIDVKRRKSEDDVIGGATIGDVAQAEKVNDVTAQATPTKPVTGIKWIETEDDTDGPAEEKAEDKAEEKAEEKDVEAAKTAEEPKDSAPAVVVTEAETEPKVKEPKTETEEVSKEEPVALETAESNGEPKDQTSNDKEEIKDGKIDDKKGDIAVETSTESKAAAPAEKPKHVFGSNSAFSGGFGAFKGGNVWGKTSTTTSSSDSTGTTASAPASPAAPSVASTPSSGYVFGSGTKFAGGFSSVMNNLKKDNAEKSDNPWAEKKEEKKESEKVEGGEDGNSEDKADDVEKEADSAEIYIGVSTPLAKKESMETGEEGEESVFTCRAKLYHFDLTNPTDGWKERGVGQVHVNKLKPEDVTDTCVGRVVMRTDAVHRVVLNLGLVKGLEVAAGMGASLSSDKVIRMSTIENGKPVQYALKTGNPDAAKQLLTSVKGLIPT